jgi:CO dehydrogenase maturation factor
VRSLTAELFGAATVPTVVDIEAGLEHLSRGTARHVDALLVVAEPWFKSMETGARVAALGRELGIGQVVVAVNKVRSAQDEEEVAHFFAGRGCEVGAIVPSDDVVLEAERRGQGPLDVAQTSPAIARIGDLVERLFPSPPGAR